MGGTSGNDIWGWSDAQTGNEYALMGMNNGVAFVDISNPEDPAFLGRLPTQTGESIWRDIKVYRDHAYIVADDAGAHGMQVFDLRRLRGLSAPQTFSADVVYGNFRNAHNLAINEDTGFAYAVGTNTCGSGLHIVDIRTPNNPLFSGCHSTVVTHDTQCVVYQGPDADHLDREICISSNEDHVEVVDVTDKFAPLNLSSTRYPQLAYVHQGWLTEDHRFFLLGDELDEYAFNLSTRTHVFDVSDLDAPVYVFPYSLGPLATDHNLYVLGNRVFEANYRSGLRGPGVWRSGKSGVGGDRLFSIPFPISTPMNFKAPGAYTPTCHQGPLLSAIQIVGCLSFRCSSERRSRPRQGLHGASMPLGRESARQKTPFA